MSNKTPFLDLYKKDPVADRNDTFNITTMLNDNWDKLDTALFNLNKDKVDKITGKGLSTNDFTTTLKNKLDGIESGATKYTHPATHDPLIIKQDTNNRFVTDTEKTRWNKVDDKVDKTNLESHLADDVSQTNGAHGIRVNETLGHIEYYDGEWKVPSPPPEDTSGSPGKNRLIAGTMEEGFFGEVPASELITGGALASECGISQGTSQHSTAGWLKFAYKGEILFVAKKPIRHSISWDAINTANCVYGDSGDKTVVIGGKTYKVTLMRALEPSNDPKTVASANSGEVNHHSEWNRLMCQIHEKAIDGSWFSPDNIESNIGILEHSLGSGSQGMYSNADLNIASGDGRDSWCQEMSTSTSGRLHRGNLNVSVSGSQTSSDTRGSNGWRPVLRLVEED